MKTINETFEDKEHDRLKDFKNGSSWHDFIMSMFEYCLEESKKGNFKIREVKND